MLDALIEAIIAGRLSHRQARIALAVTTGGQMGARRLEAVTGIDRAHCVRVLAELKAMGWVERDGDGARPVDNSPGACAESAHGVCQKSTLGVPERHTCAEKAHVPESAPIGASSGCVPKEHPRNSGSGVYTETTTTTTAGEQTALVFPRSFTPDQQTAAKRMLAPLNGHAQDLLDEVAGRYAAGFEIKNPLAYLRGLVQRAKAGGFTPEAGISVAEARRRAEAMQRARKENEDAHLAELKRSTPPGGSLKAALEALKRGQPAA